MSNKDKVRKFTLYQHLDELRRCVVRITLSIMIFSIIIFTGSLSSITISGRTFPMIYFDVYDNISSNMVLLIQEITLPEYVEVILTTPGQALVAQLYVAILVGIIFSFPIILRESSAFLSPGLYPDEKRILRNLIIPSTILFVSGVVFALYIVVPYTMDFLYKYGLALQAQTFITINELISFVVFFLLAFGISFQLPVVMWVLSRIGLVKPQVWKENWRYTFIFLVIFGAIITPDGSGITMWFIVLPMMFLYIIGYLATKTIKDKNENLTALSV